MASSVVGARWAGHPLLAAFSGQRSLAAYVRFTMWDVVAKKFVPLPPGVPVKLMDDSSAAPTTLASAPTNAQGVATLNVGTLTPAYPDLYFVADMNNMQTPFAHQATLPKTWSTKGWRSRDGFTPGHQKAFAGSSIGTVNKPIEFEIGAVLCLNIVVESTTEPGVNIALPENTEVALYPAAPSTVPPIDGRVDSAGAVTFFSFDLTPQTSFHLMLTAKNASPVGGFPLLADVYVDRWPGAGAALTSLCLTPDNVLIKSTRTSIGVHTGDQLAPRQIELKANRDHDACAAFTCLKNLAELNMLIHYAAGPSDWDDYSGQHINVDFISGGISFPVNSINLSEYFTNRRRYQFHEASHQLLWRWATLTTGNIAALYCKFYGIMKHSDEEMLGSVHALLEGWAEIFEYISRYRNITLVKHGKHASLYYDGSSVSAAVISDGSSAIAVADLPTQNWGEHVEGVFAAAMFTIFRNYVLPYPPTSGSLLPPTNDGDITAHAHLKWLTDPGSTAQTARKRFQDAFIEPAKALASLPKPTTTDFVDELRKRTPAAAWPGLLAILQGFNLGFPEIVQVYPAGTLPAPLQPFQPASIAAAGAQIDIHGFHFTDTGNAKVHIGGSDTPFIVASPSRIECTAPARPPGTLASVVFSSADGNDTLGGAILYV